MIKDFFGKYVLPVAMLSGGILGVGIFSLPYVAVRSGIWLTLCYLFVLTALVMVVDLLVGEIALKTPDFKRLPGFAGFHLGKWAKTILLMTAVFGGIAVLLVYLIVGSDFLKNLFYGPESNGAGTFLFGLLYFLIACIIIYFGTNTVSGVELGAIMFLLITLALIFIKGFSQINLSGIFVWNLDFGIWNFFLPYGPILFSLWGCGLIPEVEELLGRDKKRFKKIIFFAVLIPFLVYLSFIFLTVGITGKETTESALVGLKNVLNGAMGSVLLLAGAVMTFNGFVSLGLILKKTLMYDMGFKKMQAFIITCFSPMVLFLIGVRQFIPLISFIGGVFIGIDGIIILLMYKKVSGNKKWLLPLALVFVAGIIYEIVYFI